MSIHCNSLSYISVYIFWAWPLLTFESSADILVVDLNQLAWSLVLKKDFKIAQCVGSFSTNEPLKPYTTFPG